MALTMKIGKQDVMAAAIAVTSAGLLLAISSQAATRMARGQDLGAATLAETTLAEITVAETTVVTETPRPAAPKLFTVPTFDPLTAASTPVQPLQLASLMTVPGQRFDWRRRGRFSTRELLDLPLASLRNGKAAVLPVYLGRFPTHLAGLRDAKQRKEMFIKTVLPLVLRANDEIRSTRRRLLALIRHQQAQGNLSASERGFLDRLATQYEVSGLDLDELRRRVDVVPASLALAQGAEESGWGTSRFARLGNAVFGQRTFRKGGGLVPLKRGAGQRYEVKAFNNLYTSVRSYVLNLNTHIAYKRFRDKRAAFRGGGQPLDGYALIGTMQSYSERGHKYIDTIRVIMRANRLHDFDNARLLSENAGLQPS
jgi:Bax protein